MAASELPVCTRAEAALAKYNKGVIRLDVDLIGAHWLNRNGLAVSGKHVHASWRTILDRTGFVQHRYQHAIVVEIPETDIQRLRAHNQEFCNKDPLLPPVSPLMKFGCLSKTHLIYGLKCFKHGGIRWDDNAEPMVAPTNADSVNETLENGVYAMVISKQAYLDDPDNLISIMVSGNIDQSVAMPEHEIGLLSSMMSAIDKPAHEGFAPWEYIEQQLQPFAAKWETEDMRQIYNFANVAGVKQAKMLMDIHFQHINPQIVVVKPSFFGACATMSKDFKWCRMSLVVAQYLLVGEQGFERTGRVLVACGIKEASIKKLAKDFDLQDTMRKIKTFLMDYVVKYDLAGLSACLVTPFCLQWIVRTHGAHARHL